MASTASASLIPSGPIGGLASESQILQREALAEEKRDSLSGAATTIPGAQTTGVSTGASEKESRSKSAPANAVASPGTMPDGVDDGGDEKYKTGGEVQSEVLPGKQVLERIYGCKVKDREGRDVRFGSLVGGSSTTMARRVVVVFIRHFFCGLCQEYIRALSKGLPTTTLSALNPPTTLIIIGCGSPDLINNYASETACPYPIYADPSRAIYQALDLSVNFDASGPKPEYLTVGLWENTWTSIKQGLKAGLQFRKTGKLNQNGGEYIWTDGELAFAHKMKGNLGHLEVKDLEKVLQ